CPRADLGYAETLGSASPLRQVEAEGHPGSGRSFAFHDACLSMNRGVLSATLRPGRDLALRRAPVCRSAEPLATETRPTMRSRFPLLAAVVPVALAAALALTTPAAAQWTICNESSFIAQVSIAYPEGERRVTEGWTRVRPGECSIARRAALTPGPHYIYA